MMLTLNISFRMAAAFSMLCLFMKSAMGGALVGHWKLDDASGTVAVDSSGHNNHGTLRGNPTWTTGKIGGALYFDGNGDDVVARNVAVNSTAGAQNTVTFWLKWAGSEKMPFGWGYGVGTEFGLWFKQGAFGINTGQNDILGISSAGLRDQWKHVAVIFYNGVPEPSTARSISMV